MTTSLPYAHWMRDCASVLGARSLADIVLPGSYNAGAVNLRSITVLDCGERWANTQREPVSAQLRAGIRYLDLHVQYLRVEGAYGPYLVHTPAGGIATFFGQSVAQVVADVLAFVREHPQEIVVLHFSRFYDMDATRHAHLAELLRAWLGERAPPPLARDATIGEFWTAARQLVVLYGTDRPGSTGRAAAFATWPTLWDAPSVCCCAPIPEQQLLPGLLAHFTQGLRVRVPGQLGVLLGTCKVTAAAMLRAYVWPSADIIDRAHLAAYLNPHIVDWLKVYWAKLPVNVVALDYATDSDLVATALVLNLMRNAPLPA